MDADQDLPTQIRDSFASILSLDEDKQKAEILRIYDEGCHLENSYLMLQGREEIIKSYATLARNNLTLKIEILSVTYDQSAQTCMLDINQILKPKALGGVMDITMHIIIKLQLELCDDSLYRIVDHKEIPVAQDFLSQMPILGSWYESTIRNAVGQMSMAGSSMLEYSGFLDFAPKAVETTKSTASSLKNKAGSLVTSATQLGGSALEATGVSSVLSGVTGFVKWGAASLIEEGQEIKIDCYSPSCAPGSVCYSPTCPRGQQLRLLSRSTLNDVIRGVYTGTTKRLSILRSHN